jgi:hypothetical protein
MISASIRGLSFENEQIAEWLFTGSPMFGRDVPLA